MKLLLFILLLPACLAHLNVYLSSAEVWRLLGKLIYLSTDNAERFIYFIALIYSDKSVYFSRKYFEFGCRLQT